MAITTDDAIDKFGTSSDLDNTSSAVTDDSFSVSADLLSFTNTDDTREARILLKATYSVAPSTNSTVDLYAQLIDIDGTNDSPVPSDNFQHVLMGSFPLDAVTILQVVPIPVSLLNFKTSQIHQLYIKNNAGQTLSAGWTVIITPIAIGPHP